MLKVTKASNSKSLPKNIGFGVVLIISNKTLLNKHKAKVTKCRHVKNSKIAFIVCELKL